MTEQAIVEALNIGFLAIFATLLLLGAGATITRAGRLARAEVPPPKLLIRDMVLMTGLAFPFVAILAARVSQIPPEVTRTVPWVVITSGPAVFGMVVWNYFEFFVIGRTGDHDDHDDASTN